MQFTAEIIANFIGGTIEGEPQAMVSAVAKIEEAKEGDLVFFSNPKYEEHLYNTRATIALVNADYKVQGQLPAGLTLVRVVDAYKAFASLLDLYVANKPQKSGVSKLASIHETAKVGEGVYIGDYAVIEEGAVVEDGAQVWAQVYIGDRVKVGAGTKIYPGVKIYEDCMVGKNVIIHSGTIIGSDGFGFAPLEDGTFHKIPQIGNVVVEDNVEIGANCTVDRATMGSTIIKSGVKLDNLIQIAHNAVIGDNTVMAAQAGVAGSSKLGRNVMVGGQVGIIGHLTIADYAKVGSQSGVTTNITKKGAAVFGSPALPGMDGHRLHVAQKQLPDLIRQVARLTKQLKELQGGE